MEDLSDNKSELEALNAFKYGWDTADFSNTPDGGLPKVETSGYVLDGLALTTWALRRSVDIGPEEALITVVNRGGDADTNGAIVGGALGAAYGKKAWPNRWTDKLSYGHEALIVAEKLSDVRFSALIDAMNSSGGTLDVDDLRNVGSDSSSGSYRLLPDEPEINVSFFRRVLGLGRKRTVRHRSECGHWMPIARKRCVLLPGHPPTVHHTSVRRSS